MRLLSKTVLVLFACLSALLTIYLSMNIGSFGLLEPRSYAKYTVTGGFGLSPDRLYIGVTRLLHPFFMGLLLSRIGKFITVIGGFRWCSTHIAVAAGIFVMAIGIAYACLKLYDEPVREWLKRNVLMRNAREAE